MSPNESQGHWDEVVEATELLHEERFAEALVELKKVIQANPSNSYAFYYSGVALFEVGEMEAARDAYRACIRLAPKHLGARVALAHVLRALGDLRGSIREGMAALSQSPEDGDALYAVGITYLARGEPQIAHRYLTAFLKTHPEFELKLEVESLLKRIEQENGEPFV